MALVTHTDDVHRQLDQGGLALLTLLDLTSAINTVSHDLLTHHFADIGVNGVVAYLIPP